MLRFEVANASIQRMVPLRAGLERRFATHCVTHAARLTTSACTMALRWNTEVEAFRDIALGENYFRLLGLDYGAPQICKSSTAQ